MSNRFFQKFYLRCGKCSGIQRSAQGYKPIANPILFKSETHCQDYHNEQRRAAGYSGMLVTVRCDRCECVHSNWKVLDAQQFLDAKLSMTQEERSQRLWASKS
ncbi:hypothetical protein JKF63_06515 [Porcisia hertigi]|uniref:Uncharacterized protein n=1 Tax=Porcisia hertigi TaxID=2761500 RepID=A0A836IVD2_9TRYP|nr:hypothetical protein JKF63_06515 [Porcisia hertigi]